jgi:hypothetical protein
VRDVGRFAHQLVRLDDEVRHVPADDSDEDVAHHGRDDGGAEPSCARSCDGVDERDQRPGGERAGNDEHARQDHVRLGIGDAGEDRVILEQALVSPEVDLDGEYQQHRRGGNRQPAPGSDTAV